MSIYEMFEDLNLHVEPCSVNLVDNDTRQLVGEVCISPWSHQNGFDEEPEERCKLDYKHWDGDHIAFVIEDKEFFFPYQAFEYIHKRIRLWGAKHEHIQ